MTLSNELGELFEHFALVRRGVFLPAEGAELAKTVIPIEPKNAERDDLMKRCRRKSTDRSIPGQLRIGNGFNVEYQE